MRAAPKDCSDVSNAPLISRYGAAPHFWMGNFPKTVAIQDTLSGSIVTWEKYPPGFQKSPAFKAMMVRDGVLAYWREHGFPPQCRAVGAQDFTCD